MDISLLVSRTRPEGSVIANATTLHVLRVSVVNGCIYLFKQTLDGAYGTVSELAGRTGIGRAGSL
jgi:hypothetical protein